MNMHVPSPVNLKTRGLLQTRRVRDLNRWNLVLGLYITAGLGILVGLLLFAKFTSGQIAEQDRLQLSASAQVSALRIDRVLTSADQAFVDVQPAMQSALTESVTADGLRKLRRDIHARLQDSPLRSIALVNGQGDLVLSVGTSAGLGNLNHTAQPFELDSQLATDRIDAQLGANESGVFLYQLMEQGDGARIVAEIDRSILDDALMPFPEMAQYVSASYLLDADSRVLAGHADGTIPSQVTGIALPYNQAPLEETATSNVSTSAAPDQPAIASSAILENRALSVVHISEPRTYLRTLSRTLGATVALVGATLIGVMLLISLFQNNWRKRDRRRSNSADVVARAEIASDLLNAGVIDWRVEDSSLVYSKGWRALFGYDDEHQREEIHDWINRIHEDERADARDRYQRLMERPGELDHHIRIKRANGEYIQVRERGVARMGQDNRVSRIVLVQSDDVTTGQVHNHPAIKGKRTKTTTKPRSPRSTSTSKKSA